MGKPRQETVGSYVRNRETFSFTWQNGAEGSRRWRCSCGADGPFMTYGGKHPPLSRLFQGWVAHMLDHHPEAEL